LKPAAIVVYLDAMTNRTTLELLRDYGRSIDALYERQIIRTRNVVGCYAEHLFSKAMGWTLERNAARGFDARDAGGLRYQIKARRITRRNPSTQVGDLPPGDTQEFDALGVVVFDEMFDVLRAAVIPKDVLLTLRSNNAKRPRFHFREAILTAARVDDVTALLRAAQASD